MDPEQSEFEDQYEAWLYEHKEFTQTALFESTIASLGLSPPVLYPPSTTLAAAIEMMIRRHKGSVLVGQDGRLDGVFTERDVLRKVVLAGVDVHRATLGELMTRDPETLRPDDRLVHALNLMTVGGYRHVPIVGDDGAVVGIVAMRDIVRFLVDLFPKEVLNAPPAGSGEYLRPVGG
jgi:CBS domain-containing protein